jgi:hypothetical protein
MAPIGYSRSGGIVSPIVVFQPASMSELIRVRPNLEVTELGPTVACLREVLGFQVDVEEEKSSDVVGPSGPTGPRQDGVLP